MLPSVRIHQPDTVDAGERSEIVLRIPQLTESASKGDGGERVTQTGAAMP